MSGCLTSLAVRTETARRRLCRPSVESGSRFCYPRDSHGRALVVKRGLGDNQIQEVWTAKGVRLSQKPTSSYLQWRRSEEVGCRFARVTAANPVRYQQNVKAIPSSGSPTRVAGTIARRIDELVANPAVEAVALLLPGITTLRRTAETMLALGQRPKWTVTTSALQHPSAGAMVAIHVVREIPFGHGTCMSEALVLGPYSEFPATRRAPVTAIEMYVGEPRPFDPKTGQPTVKANLAHMEMYLPTQRAFDVLWDHSVSGRLKALGGTEDNRAKAKISLVVPVAMAALLGCAP